MGFTFAFSDYLYSLDVLEDATNVGIQRTKIIGSALASALFILNLGYNYLSNAVKKLTNEDNPIFSWDELIRTFVIILFIQMYSPAAHSLDKLFSGLNEVTYQESNRGKKLEERVKKVMLQNYLDVNGGELVRIKKLLNSPDITEEERSVNEARMQELLNGAMQITDEKHSLWDAFTDIDSLTSGIMLALADFFTYIVKTIISLIAIILFKVLIVLGPLALAMSVLPNLRGQIDVWFSTLLSVGLVFVTMNILDLFLYDYLDKVVDQANNVNDINSAIENYKTNNMTSYVSFVMVILYTMSFWITSKWAGKGDAGRVVSKAVGVATAALGMAATYTISKAANKSALTDVLKATDSIKNKNTDDK